MMRLVKEYELELLSLPLSGADDRVVYVETAFNPGVNSFIESHLVELKDIFSRELLEFCFVPESCAGKMTGDLFGEGVASGVIAPSLFCQGKALPSSQGLRYRAFHLDVSCLDREHLMFQQFRDIAKAYSRREAVDYSRVTSDCETASMLQEMENLARALIVKGVRTEVFDTMIASLEQPSRLVLDYNGNPVLPEFGGMRIRLNPMEKTLYAFFLNHPEGVSADGLTGHRDELVRLYGNASVFGEWQLARNAIDALCEENKRTFYTNVSRIKHRFTGMLGERSAQHYIVRKGEDGLYRVSLPEDLIRFESRRWRL